MDATTMGDLCDQESDDHSNGIGLGTELSPELAKAKGMNVKVEGEVHNR